MSRVKVFKHITPIGMVMLTEPEILTVDHILADLVYNQKQKEGSPVMNNGGNMTECNNATKASRQSRNVPIDDNLETLGVRLKDLHERLDSLKMAYSGEPSVVGAKGPDSPPSQVRSMMLLVAELPGDLMNLADQVSNAIEKVIQLNDMIL